MTPRRSIQALKSVRILQFVMVGMCLVLLGRAFQLQIVEHDTYKPLSDKNSFRPQDVSAARGLIYDRNGVLLVDNAPIYSITVTPADFDTSAIPLLSNLLSVETQELREKIKEAQNYSWYRTSRIYTDVDFDTFSKVEENSWRLPGIGHQTESKRHYPTNLYASHIFGYLREATKDDIDQNDSLKLGDKIGKSGLELKYEDELRGDLGTEFIRVNARGEFLGPLDNGNLDIAPKEGHNIITTIDADLQALAETLMVGKSGAIVAMDPSDGSILALVSAPHYDVRRLSGRIDKDYWAQINSDSTRPLFNRAITSVPAPGSTFKPVMGLVGMELGLITPSTIVHNPGFYERGRTYGETAPVGDYDLEKALTHSSNVYFYSLMDKIATQGKLNQWQKLVTDFGLGVSNDVDLPSERRGIIPDSAWLDNRFGRRQWSLGDIINLGIGQGVISASPLQVAVMTSALANGGYKVTPHLVHALQFSDNSEKIKAYPTTKISWVDNQDLVPVHKGMRGVLTLATGGSNYYANLPDIKIAGKTGTAQNPGPDHGWFTSFAPMESPEIVVTVLVENAGRFGSVSAAPIASLLIERYLTGEIKRKHIYDYVLAFEPGKAGTEDEEDQEGVPENE